MAVLQVPPVIALQGWTERDVAGGWVAQLTALDIRVLASTPAHAILKCMELAKRNLVAASGEPADSAMDWQVDWFRVQAEPVVQCRLCGTEPAELCSNCAHPCNDPTHQACNTAGA